MKTTRGSRQEVCLQPERSSFGELKALVLVLVLNKALMVLVRIDYLGGCLALPSAVRRAGASAACETRRVPNGRRQEAQGIGSERLCLEVSWRCRYTGVAIGSRKSQIASSSRFWNRKVGTNEKAVQLVDRIYSV